MFNLNSSNSIGLLIGFVVFIVSYGNFPFMDSFGFGLTTFFLIRFFLEIGTTIPIRDLFVVTAGLQWILGPFLAYQTGNTHYKYHMYVGQDTYMSFIVPAIALFALGLYLLPISNTIFKQRLAETKQLAIQQNQLGLWLVVIGFLAPFISTLIPPSLRFVFYLLSNVKFVGAILLFKGEFKYRWLVITLVELSGFYVALQSTTFHDFLLWSVMLFLYIAVDLKLGIIQKLAVFIVGFALISVIQTVKGDFRALTDLTGTERIEAFTNLAQESLEDDVINQGSLLEQANMRLNQGWIISKVMEHVPSIEPYAEGETIQEALYAAFLPRFLAPNKKMAGGQENYERFTGFYLINSTSMGVSVVGEAYANYGLNGAQIFMGIFGLFIGLFVQILFYYSARFPTLVLWLPFIFLQSVKAETELVTVLNFMVKGALFVAGLFFIIPRISKFKL